ncbi:MAG TPA: hypothetical protein VEH84_08915, partial [Alphaproteobacteria bacterium]|nr:hypothetical protein [Alphaproteobacteria bacterium]
MPSSLRTALALLAAAALLLAPALWNGAPIAFFDSGDYIQAAFSLAPDYYRTLPYSLWLALAGGRWSLWLPLTAQALVTAWVLLQAVWAFAPARPAAHLAILAALLVLGSGLPWFTGQIMPDAFTGLIPLALAVLAYGDEGDAAAGASFGPGRGARLL